MPRNRFRCHPAVKVLCTNHGSCCKYCHGEYTATGTELVLYGVRKGGLQLPSTCVLPQGFELDASYPVCKGMKNLLSRMEFDGNEPTYVLKSTGGKYTVNPRFFSSDGGWCFFTVFSFIWSIFKQKKMVCNSIFRKILLDTFFVIFSRRFLICHYLFFLFFF